MNGVFHADLQMRLQNITIKDHDIFGKCGVNLPKKLSQKQPTAWDIVEQITTQKKSTNHFEATNILQKAVKKPKDKDSIKVALEVIFNIISRNCLFM